MLRELLVLVLDLMYLALTWLLFVVITAWLVQLRIGIITWEHLSPQRRGFRLLVASTVSLILVSSAAYRAAEQTRRILDVVTLSGVLFLHIFSYLVAIRPEIMDEY